MVFGPTLIPRSKKTGFFDKEFTDANFSVAAFLETHHRNENDFPDLIKEYIVTHHCIHTPTLPDYAYSGIIILVNKQYDILHFEITMPGRMLNVQSNGVLRPPPPPLAKIKQAQMVNVVNNFSLVHDISQNNLIISDFNFADNDVDKGRGMSSKDNMMNSE